MEWPMRFGKRNTLNTWCAKRQTLIGWRDLWSNWRMEESWVERHSFGTRKRSYWRKGVSIWRTGKRNKLRGSYWGVLHWSMEGNFSYQWLSSLCDFGVGEWPSSSHNNLFNSAKITSIREEYSLLTPSKNPTTYQKCHASPLSYFGPQNCLVCKQNVS